MIIRYQVSTALDAYESICGKRFSTTRNAGILNFMIFSKLEQLIPNENYLHGQARCTCVRRTAFNNISDNVVTTHHSPITTHHSPLTTHHSPPFWTPSASLRREFAGFTNDEADGDISICLYNEDGAASKWRGGGEQQRSVGSPAVVTVVVRSTVAQSSAGKSMRNPKLLIFTPPSALTAISSSTRQRLGCEEEEDEEEEDDDDDDVQQAKYNDYHLERNF
ncbi:hypothetical protein V9T40_014817 [Parthenolecanium corni]|uniref:Uncharacterized protein n=1 Tax=Parthenolecanium corni TaxID=536013 RepID=A0AAN9T5E2_9HEMI